MKQALEIIESPATFKARVVREADMREQSWKSKMEELDRHTISWKEWASMTTVGLATTALLIWMESLA